jgi:uncharacterized protein (TIGR04255 family)
MTFPDSNRVVYETNPLTQVLCQLRFPPILTISATAPAEFQDKIRSYGYPYYQQEVQQVAAIPNEIVQVLGRLPGAPVPSLVHKFFVEDRTGEIALTQEVLGIGTTKYLRWQDFLGSIRLAKQALEEVYHPAFYERVGLRFRNVIDRKKLNLENAPWGELIKGPILGFLADGNLVDHVTAVNSQATIKLDASQEFLILRHGLVQLPAAGEKVYAIDAEFLSRGRQSGESVFDTLGRLHTEAGNFFRWTITERLSDALGRR